MSSWSILGCGSRHRPFPGLLCHLSFVSVPLCATLAALEFHILSHFLWVFVERGVRCDLGAVSAVPSMTAMLLCVFSRFLRLVVFSVYFLLFVSLVWLLPSSYFVCVICSFLCSA